MVMSIGADPRRPSLPDPDDRWLDRPRLTGLLDRRWAHRVVDLRGPAGYGKSTALVQAIRSNTHPRRRDIWVPCGDADSSASTLIGGIEIALGVGVPSAVPSADTTAIRESILAAAPDHVCLMFDDVHRIARSSGGAAVIADLIRTVPENGHMLLSGRGEPPVALAGGDTPPDVLRIGERDLAYTDDELDAIAVRRGADPATLRDAGGWPALTELAVSSGQVAGRDHVWALALAHISPDVRRILAALSAVGSFDLDLVAAVVGESVDLDALLQRVPLVSRSGTTYSLHPLLVGALVEDLDPELATHARRTAARADANRGRFDAAIDLLIDGEMWDDVREYIVDACSGGPLPIAPDAAQRWLSQAPLSVASTPEMRLLAAVTSAAHDVSEALRALEGAAADFERAGAVRGELAARINIGYLAWMTNHVELATAQLSRGLDLETAGVVQAGPLASLVRAVGHDATGDHDRTLAELNRIPPGVLTGDLAALVDWFRASAMLGAGDLAGAAAQAAHVLDVVGEASPIRAIAKGTDLQCRWLAGEVNDAIVAEVVDTVELAGRRSFVHAEAVAAAQACDVLSFRGEVDNAAAMLARARSAAGTDMTLVGIHLAVAAAALDVARGDEAAAAVVLDEALAGLGADEVALQRWATLRRRAALVYVLVPGVRRLWDDTAVDRVTVVSVSLGQALVAIRRGDEPPEEIPPAGIVRSRMPVRWIAELGIAGVSAGRRWAWTLLEDCWPDARDPVLALGATGTVAHRKSAHSITARLPAPPDHAVDLRVLGPTELEIDGDVVEGGHWRRLRVRQLLWYLVVNGPASRDRVMAALWPDASSDAASQNLRTTLHYLLGVLEPNRPRGHAPYFIRQRSNNVWLVDDPMVAVDVRRVESTLDDAQDLERRGLATRALGRYLAALNEWRGDLVADAGEADWARIPRLMLRSRLVTAASRTGELLRATGDHRRAIEVAERALATGARSERLHRVLIAAATAAGDDERAMRAARTYQSVVADLGNEPPPLDDLLDGIDGHD